MNLNSRQKAAILAIGTMLATTPAFAAKIDITVDENGNGTSSFPTLTALSSALGTDPGPGGLASTLIYNLPFSTVLGDVLLTEGTGGVQDVLRFNGRTLVFYSDNIGGADSLADTPAPPGSLYTNVVSIDELGDELNNGAFYTPTPGQPGYFNADFSITYNFISDATVPVPEPGSLLLLGSGALALALARRRKAA